MGRIIQGEIGIPFPCQMLKTGQITQYSSKEDDGYWEKGKAKKYVVLDAGQFSGTVNIVLNAKTRALSNNCVFDKRTGLVWARYVPDDVIGPGNNGRLLWVDDANDEDVFDFKDQADTKNLGGYADWRVPNLFEMLSLFNLAVTNPPIDTVVFPSTPITVHWTSTTAAGATTKAQLISFGSDGTVSQNTKATYTAYCRLVRGPK